MVTLSGNIDKDAGIEIIHHKAGYYTLFVLNTGDKKYKVFFHDKILIPYGKTEVIGEIYSTKKLTSMFNKQKALSPEQRIIAETLHDIVPKLFAAVGKSKAASSEPYFVAEKIRDCTNNVAYTHKSI